MYTKQYWEKNYSTGPNPWDTGQAEGNLIRTLDEVDFPKGSVLEIGCGTGTNSIWLAKNGYRVTGIDIASAPLRHARDTAVIQGLDCMFHVHDIFSGKVDGAPFDWACDIGCFHTMCSDEERSGFAAKVAENIKPKAYWFSMIGSTDGPPMGIGMPRFSAVNIAKAVEPLFEIIFLRSDCFKDVVGSPRIWVCLMKKR